MLNNDDELIIPELNLPLPPELISPTSPDDALLFNKLLVLITTDIQALYLDPKYSTNALVEKISNFFFNELNMTLQSNTIDKIINDLLKVYKECVKQASNECIIEDFFKNFLGN